MLNVHLIPVFITPWHFVKSTTDSGEIANSFNDFFVTIGSELAKNIVSTTDPMSYVDPCYKVRQTILSLKNSSAGWDDFPALVAKQSIESYIEPLTCLIN